MRFQARDVRIAFPNIFKPGKFGYNALFILPPDHSQVIRTKPYLGKDGKEEAPSDRDAILALGIKLPADPKAKVKTVPLLQTIAKKLAIGKWQQKGESIYAALDKQDKIFLHDGATKADYEGFEGNYFIATNAKTKPSTFDQLRNEVGEGDGVIYSGAFVIANLDFWVQDSTDWGKRINSGLRGVQKLRDGDAFSGGGKAASADEYDEIGVEEGDASTGESADDDGEVDLTA